jgi:hypothetical protein
MLVAVADPDLCRHAAFVADINLRSGVVADQDRRQPRRATGLAHERFNIARDPRAHARSCLATIDDRGGH